MSEKGEGGRREVGGGRMGESGREWERWWERGKEERKEVTN